MKATMADSSLMQHAEEWAKVLAAFLGAFVAFRVGSIQALRNDLQTYKGRCDTLESEVKQLKMQRESDQHEIATLKAQRSLGPLQIVLERILEQQTQIATTFDEILRPMLQEHIKNHKPATRRRTTKVERPIKVDAPA